MESHRIPSTSLFAYYQEKTMDELKYSLQCTTFELEATHLAARDEIQRREEEIKHLKDLLNRVVKERDEAVEKYQGLFLQQQQRLLVQEDDRRSEESIVCESPVQSIETIGPLPEKGKLLQAVMKAGPLLQTLLLAGPLPQWRHPPPPLDAIEIPPITMPAVESKIERSISITGRKRSLMCSNRPEEDPSAMTPSSPPLQPQSEGVYNLSYPASFLHR